MSKVKTTPIWFLGPGCKPIRSDGRRIPEGAMHWCHEGDEQWTPIEAEQPKRTKAKTA